MLAENARNSYHASLLHLFFAAFKLNRLARRRSSLSVQMVAVASRKRSPSKADDKSYAGLQSSDDYKLEDLRLIDVIDEHPDRVHHQIVTMFPISCCRRHRMPSHCGSSPKSCSVDYRPE